MSKAPRSACSPAASPRPSIAGAHWPPPPLETALGALLGHITGGADAETYQPMNVNFGLIPPIEGRKAKKADRKKLYTDRARAALKAMAGLEGGARSPPSRSSRPASSARGLGAVVAYSAGVSQLALVGVGVGELVDRPHRPFLEAQPAVPIDVELGEGLAPRLDQLGRA